MLGTLVQAIPALQWIGAVSPGLSQLPPHGICTHSPGPALSPSRAGTSSFSFSSVRVLRGTKSLHSQYSAVSLVSHKTLPSQGYLSCSNLKMSFGSLFHQKSFPWVL